MKTVDDEVEAITKVNQALSSVKDEVVRGRVLSWAISKYGSALNKEKSFVNEKKVDTNFPRGGDEIAGIAKKTEAGIEITVRDLKAKNQLNAGLRLALVSIYAYEELTGERGVSSRRFLSPLLQEWRLYDGNVRKMLANYKGIIRNGDSLTLDRPARKEAEQFINDILNEEVAGKWSPSRKGKKRKLIKKSK